MEARDQASVTGSAERFLCASDSRQARRVPDLIVGIPCALEALRPEDRRLLDVPSGAGVS